MQNPQNTLHFPPPPPPDHLTTTGDPLTNLATIQSQLDSLSQTLSNSVNTNTPLSQNQSQIISSQHSTAILHVIINGASLITSSHNPTKTNGSDLVNDPDIIELDEETLTADQCHVCEFCGKGFKRDANLRMHMRAHGDKFKTLESLSKPINDVKFNGRVTETRFSCPYVGCNRNKKHKRFKPLKSVVCVKNHFKRFHCVKMFSCNRCKCKSFSVLSDLKRHMKNCSTAAMVEVCSCGGKFPTKDELFRHVSVSEGHMPAACGGAKIDDDDNDGFGLIDEDDDLGMGLWSSIQDFVQFS